MHKTDDLNAPDHRDRPSDQHLPGLAGGMPGHPGNHMIGEGFGRSER